MIYISSELLFIKLLTTRKIFLILAWLNINFVLLKIGRNQARYVGRGTCLRWLPPPEKSSASLGDNKDEKHLLTNSMVWHPVSHTSDAQGWVTTGSLTVSK